MDHLVQDRLVGSRRRGNNLHLLLERGVVDPDVEHEPVQLSLWQWIGSLLLDGILSGQDEEGKIKGIGYPSCRHLVLLHRLKESRLSLGRSSIDLIGQKNIGKDRSL